MCPLSPLAGRLGFNSKGGLLCNLQAGLRLPSAPSADELLLLTQALTLMEDFELLYFQKREKSGLMADIFGKERALLAGSFLKLFILVGKCGGNLTVFLHQ
jgi:hypothetical protein